VTPAEYDALKAYLEHPPAELAPLPRDGHWVDVLPPVVLADYADLEWPPRKPVPWQGERCVCLGKTPVCDDCEVMGDYLFRLELYCESCPQRKCRPARGGCSGCVPAKLGCRIPDDCPPAAFANPDCPWCDGTGIIGPPGDGEPPVRNGVQVLESIDGWPTMIRFVESEEAP